MNFVNRHFSFPLQAGGLCGDATIVEPMTQVAGISIIFDFKDIGMSQVKALTPAFAKKMIYFLTVSTVDGYESIWLHDKV